MISNIIFDWSGVINDNVDAIYQTIMEMFRIHGVSSLTFEEFKKQWVQPYMSFYNKFLPNITQEDEIELFRKIVVKFDKNQKYQNIDQLIKRFKRNKINLFVVTSDLSTSIDIQLKVYGLNNIFTEIVTESHHKTAAVKYLLEKYKLRLDSTIIIGDSNHEIEVGHEIGIKTCAVTWGFCLEEKLLSFHPDFIAHNLTELEDIILK